MRKLLSFFMKRIECLNLMHKNQHFLSKVIDSHLSDFVYIDAFSVLKNSQLGSYSYVSRSSKIINSNIGRYCSIGPECRIGMGSHPIDQISTSPIFHSKNNHLGISIGCDQKYETIPSIVIGSDVWIGSRAMIMSGVEVGNGAIVAANAVVVKDVEPFSIVAGVPAKKIKMRFNPELIKLLNDSEWWKLTHEELSIISEAFFSNSKIWNSNITEKVCLKILKLNSNPINKPTG